jgi:hypothetical protein
VFSYYREERYMCLWEAVEAIAANNSTAVSTFNLKSEKDSRSQGNRCV